MWINICAQQSGKTAPRVSGHEQVVLTFVRVGIAHQPAFGADRSKLVVPPRDQFVGINLMTSIPDQSVPAEVEHGVQRDTQLDHT